MDNLEELKELQDLRNNKYEEIRELNDKINEIEIGKYLDMVGKFYKVSEIDNGYIYIYSVFRHGKGKWGEPSVIIRGNYFSYEQTEYWDGSYFDWATDRDICIDNIYNDAYKFEEITREEYENAFNDYYEKLKPHFMHITEKAVNDWTEMKQK